MKMDSESSTHTRMDSRSSHMYLQVWCGVLTVAMVVMAALVISNHPKLTEEEVSTLKPDNVSPTGPTAVNSIVASPGSTPSYIQLIMFHHNDSWQEAPPSCRSCPLSLSNESIHFKKSSTYFIYAQVNFRKPKHLGRGQRSVTLKRNPTNGRGELVLVEGTFPETTVGSVWVGKIVNLSKGDSVSLEITAEFAKDSQLTFWGAFQLH
ncbi:uncharacterized protein LOC117468568 isoform X1 [Trematomus bernacchii]|uniref:uncharacterized protein LOC117468568 isoform X1 n=1 Tax=Trematomus bernacchii TaxID=40690 RepID=UPI00146AA66C|nr:uncharacterized protein LOC117468568 isoform X1 [Trematomus bernacchii]